jgi:hypothetical protein
MGGWRMNYRRPKKLHKNNSSASDNNDMEMPWSIFLGFPKFTV